MKCKSELRRAVLARRNALSPQEIRLQSAAAGSRLFELLELKGAGLVMFFVSFGSEIDTLPMIRQALAEGKRVAAPRADPETRELTPCEITDTERDLAPGAHEIREPKAHCPAVGLDEIDVVLVPAAAWGEDGHRLGYGGGYYDRFLPRLPRARRVGLGLEVQVVAEVPHGERDLPVEVLVTDAAVRRFAHAARPE
ncbi:MAG: 5-formyltetrahydrofolate cyclo-ligase [Armatimonadota bacterium]|nr:MAG: 5-formyltetrahydrofolate cyclo-ligase [Armatimonadota bacterium]